MEQILIIGAIAIFVLYSRDGIRRKVCLGEYSPCCVLPVLPKRTRPGSRADLKLERAQMKDSILDAVMVCSRCGCFCKVREAKLVDDSTGLGCPVPDCGGMLEFEPGS